MNKLTSTAKKLDTFFKIFNVLIKVIAITMLVCVAIIAAAFLFDLPAEMIGTGYNTISFGPLELTIAEPFAPDTDLVLAYVGILCALAVIICFIARLCIKSVRQILAPMVERQPFNGSIALNLKKLAKYSLFLGIAANVFSLIANGMLVGMLNLPEILISEQITHVTVNSEIDLSFLIVSAAFLLLSYIFQYGQELQILSDETL